MKKLIVILLLLIATECFANETLVVFRRMDNDLLYYQLCNGFCSPNWRALMNGQTQTSAREAPSVSYDAAVGRWVLFVVSSLRNVWQGLCIADPQIAGNLICTWKAVPTPKVGSMGPTDAAIGQATR